MPTVTAGLVPLQAPLPSPRQFDLLAAATLVEPTTDRWLGGAWTGGDVPGPASTHDPCSRGTLRAKADPGDIGSQISGRFIVYLPGFCQAASIGPNPDFWTDRLSLAFQVYEGAAIERVLATGDGHGTLGPYLADENMEELAGGAAVTALRGLELLEEAIAVHGTGIIHAAPATAISLDGLGATENLRGQKRTRLGTPIAVGAGYTGVDPDDAATPASDQQWAFASGPIEVYRSDIITNPGNYSEALDRSLNDVMFYAERPYLFNWIARQDPDDGNHVQAGALIDLVP